MINFLVYILSFPLILLVSILPFWALYLLSDFIYLILFYIVGYRKKVVLDNLKIAFPDKSDTELKQLRKKFYHHFVDIFMEMIKTFTISEKEILKRFFITNEQEFANFLEKHPSAIIVSSHYANYEWFLGQNIVIKTDTFGVYKKIKNKYFDNFVKRSRSKFSTILVPTKELFPLMEKNFANKRPGIYGFLNDQSPKMKKAHHSSTFFGVEVPVHTAAEMLAKKYNYPVLYFNTEKIKRGFYKTTMHVLSESPRELPDYKITDMFMQKLEIQIRKQPEYYFWTHKRFKHAK
ncbi:MAG: lipid A biosynthesis acyltransferase [Bacteroidota bacterium]